MSKERAYTVRELADLRRAVEQKWLFGTYHYRGGGSRCYKEDEKTTCVEAIVQTHMLAGHTAEDLLKSEPFEPAK